MGSASSGTMRGEGAVHARRASFVHSQRGGYTGFVRFYAHLTKNEKGEFVKAALRAVEPPNRETNVLDPRWLNGICEQFGYDDFSLAR
jgi:hypothetical protein